MNETASRMSEKYLNKSACRLCFQENCSTRNNDMQNDKLIREKILYCTNINLIKNELFPEIICSECLLDLSIAYVFKKRCEESEKILRTFIQIEIELTVSSSLKTELNVDSHDYSETLSDVKLSPIVSSPLDNQIKTELAPSSNEQDVSNKVNEIECLDASDKNNSNKSKSKVGKKKNNNVYNCNICEVKCISKWTLSVHMRTHGQKPFQCDICPTRFVSNWNLTMHKRVTHEEHKQVCPECGKSFNGRIYLKRHLVVHQAEKPTYGCTVCQRRFITKSYLKEHMARHRGNKKFICEVCGWKFVSEASMKQHMLIHGIGKKDFKKHSCTFCTYRTKGRADLERHVRTHTGERPFRCLHEGCTAAFPGKTALNLHSRIHTGEKPYACNKCPAQFSRSGNFKNHLLKKHKIVNGPDNRSRLIVKELAEKPTTGDAIPELMEIKSE